MTLTSGAGPHGDTHHATLQVLDATPQRSGTYTLQIRAGGDGPKDAAKFNVTVTTHDPQFEIWISKQNDISQKVDPRFLQLDHSYNVVAFVTGKPFPTVEVWQAPFACKLDNWKHEQFCKWSPLKNHTITNLPGTFESATTARFIALTSTYYKIIQHYQGRDIEKRIRIIVTNIEDAEDNSGMNLVNAKGNGPPDMIVYEGQSFAMGCMTQKYDYGTISWYRVEGDQKVLLGSSVEPEHFQPFKIIWDTNSEYSNTLRLEFASLNVQDSYEYLCEGQLLGINDDETIERSVNGRAAPEMISMKHKLQVHRLIEPQFLPTDWPKSGSKTVPLGKRELVLNCSVTGEPQPSVQWTKDGQIFTKRPESGTHYDTDTYTFTFDYVVKEDAGVYVCNATNPKGSRFKTMIVDVDTGTNPVLGSGGIIALCLGLVVATFLVIFLVAALVYQRHKEQKQNQQLRNLYHGLKNNPAQELDPTQPLNHQAEGLAYDEKFELMKTQLQLGELIGEGQFGRVLRGTLLPPPAAPTTPRGTRIAPLPVAVKVPQNGRSLRDQKALLDELKIMIALGHHVNVLGLIGAVTKYMVKGELYVVIELCELGSVLTYLKSHRASFLDEIVHEPSFDFGFESALQSQRVSSSAGSTANPINRHTNSVATGVDGYLTPNRMTMQSDDMRSRRTSYQCEVDNTWAHHLSQSRNHGSLLTTTDLLSFSYQTANGMDFLSRRNLLHRDLAARNLLLTKERLIKIADFGLARQDMVYHIQTSRNVPLPMKWMALESILDHEFSAKSDIWSFGVVMWEIFELGTTPYPTVPLDPSFVTFLREGNRLGQPKYAPNEIYDIMIECWLREPKRRPTFAECRDAIGVQLQRCSAQFHDVLTARLHPPVESAANQNTAVPYENGESAMLYINWRPMSASDSENSSLIGETTQLQPIMDVLEQKLANEQANEENIERNSNNVENNETNSIHESEIDQETENRDENTMRKADVAVDIVENPQYLTLQS